MDSDLGLRTQRNSYALSRVNGAADVVTFNKSDNYSNTPASIEVRAIDFFAAAAAANAKSADFTGLNLGSFFDGANNYHISVGIAQGTDLGNFFYQPYSDPIYGDHGKYNPRRGPRPL